MGSSFAEDSSRRYDSCLFEKFVVEFFGFTNSDLFSEVDHVNLNDLASYMSRVADPFDFEQKFNHE